MAFECDANGVTIPSPLPPVLTDPTQRQISPQIAAALRARQNWTTSTLEKLPSLRARFEIPIRIGIQEEKRRQVSASEGRAI
jgi:hypothetical protein